MTNSNVIPFRPTNKPPLYQLAAKLPQPTDGLSIDKDDLINNPPWILEETLKMIRQDFDLEACPTSGAATACRIMTATISRLREVQS